MVRKLILERLQELGLNMAQISRQLGRNETYLQQFMKKGSPRELRERERSVLAEILKVPEDQLRGFSDPLPAREYTKASVPVSNVIPLIEHSTGPENSLDNFKEIRPIFGNRDLPVFGTAQGGREGALVISDRAVDWEARPDFLLKVTDAYAMIIRGDSMAPEHKDGSTALVNPNIPPRNGHTCIFRCHKDDGEVLVMIKELRRFNDQTWYVHQHNPPKDFQLKRSEWQICHVTVGNYFRKF